MKIETKLDIGDVGYFLTQNKICESTIIEIQIIINNGRNSTIYEIENNPMGSQYMKRIHEGDIFATKQDLLNSL